jgi:hypothetical protein
MLLLLEEKLLLPMFSRVMPTRRVFLMRTRRAFLRRKGAK